MVYIESYDRRPDGSTGGAIGSAIGGAIELTRRQKEILSIIQDNLTISCRMAFERAFAISIQSKLHKATVYHLWHSLLGARASRPQNQKIEIGCKI